MNEDNHIEVENLIVKHLVGELTATEERELQEWLSISENNRQVYQAIRRTFDLAAKHYPSDHVNIDVDVEKEWSRFVTSVDQSPTRTIQFVQQLKGLNIWKVAAVLLLLIFSGFIANYLIFRSGDFTYRTAEQTEVIELPDGSTVSLNRNSELSYSKDFGEGGRNVSLKGEAFFEVVPDAGRPFVVNTTQVSVTVIGTSFNVQNYDDKNDAEVVVETGIVRFQPKSIGQGVELRAGEAGVFKKAENTLNTGKNDNVNYLAWKTKRIVLDASSLVSIVRLLNAAYGADIVITTSVSPTCQATVTFENQSLEAVLSVLKSTLDLTYKKEGNRIEIIQAGC